MFVENGTSPKDDTQHERTSLENAQPISRDLASSGAMATPPSTFVLTDSTTGLSYQSLQGAISFELRLESAMQRLGTMSTSEASRDNDGSTMITPEELLGWRKQHGMKLIGNVVERILDFLAMTPMGSLLEIAALAPQAENVSIPFSFLTTLHAIRKTYHLSDPDWWPFLRLQHAIRESDGILLAKHNLAVATLYLLQSGIKLPDLHEEFLNIYVLPNERLDVWQADLYFAIKITLVINNCPLSEILFSEAFPEPARRVLQRRNQATDTLPEILSDGERLLLTRCEYVRSQYNAGAFSTDELEKLRGGRTWHQSIQRALPYVIHLIKRILQNPLLARTDPSNLQGRSACPETHNVPKKGRTTLSQDDLPGTTTILPEALGEAVRRLIGKRSETPNIDGVDLNAVHDTSRMSAERQAAVLEPTLTTEAAKTSRQSAHTRRPWTSEEEAALLVGLATVAGPHWSQILALYGATGSISNILRDRSQVQLKDKARNLKLSYLKAGKEVPSELRGVTGSLGKRKRTLQGDGNTAEGQDMGVGS